MNQITKEKLSIDELINILVEKEKKITSLKSENEMLRNIIALIPGNVYWKDKKGRCLGCNNNMAKIFGFATPNEIIGKGSDFFQHELLEPFIQAEQIDKQVYTSAREKYVEEKGLNILQQPAIYLTKKLPLFDDYGKVIGILGVSFDITERKKMEDDLKIAKEKAEASESG